MSFAQLLSILRARFWVAALVFSLVVGITLAVSLLLPKQYTALTSVVIDVRPDPVSAMGAGNLMASPAFMATQADVMGSDRVVLYAIRDLKLLDNPELRNQWQADTKGVGSIEQWLLGALKRRIDIRPSRESNVITIAFLAPDPRFASGMANALAKAYIATTLELRGDPAKNFKNLFDDQTKDARERLEQAQAKLSEFQQKKGIIAADERFDVENARLNELSSQLTQLQAIATESSSRQTQALSGQGDKLQEVLSNPLVASLKADLSRAEVRMKELTSRLGDNHPQVVEVRANLAEIKNRIEAETARITSGVGVTNTINRSREAQVQRDLASQRAKVLQMKTVRDEALLLQRDVESAQRIYESLALRQSQTMLETQNSQSFANQLSVAQPPTEHSTPRVAVNTALAMVLGLGLALGLALLLELLDRRVRSVDDVVASLGLPVLGTMPTPKARRYLAGNRALPLHGNPQYMQIGGPARPQQGA